MNIEEYEFSNSTTFAEVNHESEVYIEDDDDCFVILDKGDAIALAKHFKLTTDDIEGE